MYLLSITGFEPFNCPNHTRSDVVRKRFGDVHKFISCFQKTTGLAELKTKSKTRFIAKANITKKGPHTGEKVIRFMQDNKKYARAYECYWGHYYNCNRTRIGLLCAAVDVAVDSK